MKKIGFILLAIFALNIPSTFGQTEETGFNLQNRLVPHFGFVQMIPTTEDQFGRIGLVEDIFFNSPTVRFYNFHVGTYAVLFHHKDIVSIGLDQSAQVGVRLNLSNPDIPTTYNIQVPIFLMGKLGSGATPYNQQRIGISAGIGASINHMKFTLSRPTAGSSVGNLDVIRTTTFVSPAAVLEASYGNLIGRLQLGLGTVNTRGNDQVIPSLLEDPVDAVHGLFGFGLIYRL
ncbi:MAG: hypothetical protein AAFY71_05720 [Bacteroidota bacterium]